MDTFDRNMLAVFFICMLLLLLVNTAMIGGVLDGLEEVQEAVRFIGCRCEE